MADPTPARPVSDRNLLFGILALQRDFISEDALIAAMHAWILDKAKPLGDILRDHGALTEGQRAELDTLVERDLRGHGGDPELSLGSVGHAAVMRVVLDELRRLADPDLDASLERVGATPAADRSDGSTEDHVPGTVGGAVYANGDGDAPRCSPARYRVLRLHAKGGLGEVFVAEDTELHREVAFKEIQRPYAHDPRCRSRFVLEAEVNGRLEHPGVVPVYGLGSYRDGRPFYAMRFVRGESLREAIARFHQADRPGRDPGDRALALRGLLGQFVAVCNAVAYAHSRGVLHRDLKPANVMLGKFGETLVVDWGLAKVIGRPEGESGGEEVPLRPAAGDGSATVAGTAVGTPAYMSPEQAEGRPELLGPASDVYSLGATLYHLLTGRPPLQGKDVRDVLRCVVRGEWVPPWQAKRGVPAALDAVCRRAMALNPQDRYLTAQALAADVERWLADEPVTAYREPLLRRLGRWRRRHPAWFAAAAVLLLAAAAAGAWLKLERDAVARDVRAALDEVEQQQARGQWPEARAALERARGRLAGGGPAGLRRRVRQAQADLDMADDLEGIRLLQTEVKGDDFDLERADPAYAAAFRGYGLEVMTADPGQTAERIAASAIREQLIVALDHWAGAKPKTDARGRERLLSLARLADRDPWRRQLRAPEAWNDKQALKQLARQPAALEQPPVTVLALAGYLWRANARAEAVGLLRRAQQRHPGDFWLNHYLAAYLQVSEPSRREEALGFYRAALAVRPRSAAGHSDLGAALSQQGRDEEAEAALRRAVAFKEDYAPAHNNLGIALNSQGRHREAEAAFRRAIALSEDQPQAHVNLGAVLSRQGRDKEAEAAFRRAVTLKDRYPVAHYGLGNALHAQGRDREAEAALRRAVALKDGYPEAHHNLGAVLYRQGRDKEAEAAFRRAIALKDDYAEARCGLGNALYRQRRDKEAEAALRRATALKGDDTEAHYSLGAVLYRQGRDKDAEAAFRRATALKEDHPLAHYGLGNALSRQGRDTEAETALRRATALMDHYPEAHFKLGTVLYGQGRYREAEAAFRRAVGLKDDFPEAHCNLGHALQGQGQFALAIASLKRGHELGSKSPRWRYPSAQWLQQAQRLLELDRRLTAVRKGGEQPRGAAERLRLASLCQQPYKRLYATAARLYAEAFASERGLADDPRAPHRYDAACAAALAAAGKGGDSAGLDAEGRARLRGQALAWLRADLGAWAGRVENGTPQERAAAAKVMRHWQADPDFADVRGPTALAKLPEAERADWQRLWADVQAVLEKAGAGGTGGN